MERAMIDERFGIARLKGEELIFEAQPTGFIRYQLIVACLSIVGIVFLPFVWLGSWIAQRQYRYWLTNRRVILASGFIGYKVRSIPLERIADVSLSRSLPEMVAGVSSLEVRDMTGEATSGASLVAITDSTRFQRQILEEVQRVNSELASV